MGLYLLSSEALLGRDFIFLLACLTSGTIICYSTLHYYTKTPSTGEQAGCLKMVAHVCMDLEWNWRNRHQVWKNKLPQPRTSGALWSPARSHMGFDVSNMGVSTFDSFPSVETLIRCLFPLNASLQETCRKCRTERTNWVTLGSGLNTSSPHVHRLCFPKNTNPLHVRLSAEKLSERRKRRRQWRRIKPSVKMYSNGFIRAKRVTTWE